MNKLLRRLIVTTCAIAILAVIVYPILWRRASYRFVHYLIEQGYEDAAIREVRSLSKQRLFEPDWTPRAVMPTWRWVHELDFRLNGCPSCRGVGATLLQLAARRGQPRLVATLIQCGASVDCNGDRGGQVLVSAVGSGNTNVIATLLASGADANARSAFGTVLHVAAGFSSKPEVMEVLLDAGAKPNATDSRGWTPLDWAMVWNSNAKRVLLARGGIEGTNRRNPLPINR